MLRKDCCNSASIVRHTGDQALLLLLINTNYSFFCGEDGGGVGWDASGRTTQSLISEAREKKEEQLVLGIFDPSEGLKTINYSAKLYSLTPTVMPIILQRRIQES